MSKEILNNSKNRKFEPLPDPRGEQPKYSDMMKERNELYKKVLGQIGNERIIGDLHYFDKNIIGMAPRNFKSVAEMNDHMIESWNSVTEPDDTVIVNGDFIDFGNCTVEEGYDIINRLNGRRITLIVGNHDKPFLDILREYGPRLEVIEYSIIKDQFWIISHEPQYVSNAAPYANIFAHVHLNPMYRDVSSRSFCTSAERLDYKPILLEDAMNAVRNFGRRLS